MARDREREKPRAFAGGRAGFTPALRYGAADREGTALEAARPRPPAGAAAAAPAAAPGAWQERYGNAAVARAAALVPAGEGVAAGLERQERESATAFAPAAGAAARSGRAPAGGLDAGDASPAAGSGDAEERRVDRVADAVAPGGRPPDAGHAARPGSGAVTSPAHAATAEPGEPLEPTLRSELGRWIRGDLSRVRLHHRGPGAEAARSAGALGFAMGRHVFLAPGRYAPWTPAGQWLLAHEVAHAAAAAEGDRTIRYQPAPPGAADPSLAPTPGGLRVGLLDPALEAERVRKATAALKAGIYSQLDSEYWSTWQHEPAPGARFSDALARPLFAAQGELDTYLSLAPAMRDAYRASLVQDLAVLCARVLAHDTPDWTRFASDVVAVCRTYQLLAHVHYQLQIEWITSNDPSMQGKERSFQDRAKLLLDQAHAALGVRTPAATRVYEGLAADLARLEAGEKDTAGQPKRVAPERGAELLVYALLDDPPRLDQLALLYGAVIGQVRASGATGAMVDTLARDLDGAVARPVAAALQAASQKGAGERERVRRALAVEIGQFLARLDADDALDLVPWTVSTMAGLGGTSAPKDLTDAIDAAVEEESARLAAPAAPAKAPAAAPRHVCKSSYDRSHVAAYLGTLLPVPRKAAVVTFDPTKLICQFRGYHTPELAAKVPANAAEWYVVAGRVMKALAGPLGAALARDREIGALRVALGADAEPAPVPDYLEELRLTDRFWTLLGQAADDRDLRTGVLEDEIVTAMAEHFFALTNYQRALIELLGVLKGARHGGLEAWLLQRYRETHGLQLQLLLDLALGAMRWPGVQQKTELASGDGLRARTVRLRKMLELAERERALEHRTEIEKEVYARLPAVVVDVRRAKPGQDLLRVGDVRPALRPMLRNVSSSDEKLLDEIIGAALVDANRAWSGQLQVEAMAEAAQPGAMGPDVLKVLDRANRMKTLREALDAPVREKGDPELLIGFVQGQTENLIGLFIMAQTALGGSGIRPGDVVRAANLLRLAMKHFGAATLNEAVEKAQNNEVELMARVMEVAADQADFLRGSDKELLDRAATWGMALQSGGTVAWAEHVIEESKKGALGDLLAAERAGGGAAGRKAIAKLAERVRNNNSVAAKSVAMFIYSWLLDAVQPLQEPGERIHEEHEAAEQAREERAEFLKAKKGSTARTVQEQKREASWDDAIKQDDKVKAETRLKGRPKSREDEISAARKRVVDAFDAGKHPMHGDRKLTTDESGWWKAYDQISGATNYLLPGEKGTQEAIEFGKGVVLALSVGAVTGGVGGFVAEGLVGTGVIEGGTAAFATETLVGTALFTESMRLIQEGRTGQRSTTPLLEDFLVNLAMAGAGQFAAGRAARYLDVRGVTGLSASARIFGAEYAAVSGVGLLHLHLSALARGGVVTSEDHRRLLLENVGFMLAARSFAAFGEPATARFDAEAASWKDPKVAQAYRDLAKALRPIDARLAASAAKVRDAKTAEERAAALDEHAAILLEKGAAIRRSSIPDAKEVASGFRSALDLFQADAAHAKLLDRIGAMPIGETANFAYEPGSANEAALQRHFAEIGVVPKVELTLAGDVYEVAQPDGTVLRFEPREPAGGGLGTQAGAFARRGRIAGERVPGKGGPEAERVESGNDVGKILRADSALHPSIQSSRGDRLVLAPYGVKCRLVAVDEVTTSASHRTGPVGLTLQRVDGKWAATLEVRRDAPNDHILRGVNHEAVECGLIIADLEAKAEAAKAAGEPPPRYDDPKVLARAVREEANLSSLGRGVTGRLTAHDVALVNADLATLGAKLQEVTRLLDAGPSEAQQRVLLERRDLVSEDIGRMWRLLDLPVSKGAFAKRMAELKKAGLEPSRAAQNALRMLRFWKGEAPTIEIVDLQQIFNELVKANSKLVTESSFLGFKEYYETAIRAKAEAAIKAAVAKGADDATALAAGLEVVKELAGGTSVASLRGRSFEGLSLNEYNAQADLVADRGWMRAMEKSTFPTFDAFTLKGYEGEVRQVIEKVPLPGGGTKEVLVLTTARGRVLARQLADNTVSPASGIEVWLVSMKAKGASKYAKDWMRVREMKKAMGTAKTPTRQGMITVREYVVEVDRIIHDLREKVSDYERRVILGESIPRKKLYDARYELTQLEFFRRTIQVSGGWSAGKLDALLESLKDDAVDSAALRKALIRDFGP